MDMFKMMKEAAAMRSKLSEMEKSLKAKIIEVDSHGVKIKINAKSEMLDLKLSPELLQEKHEKIERTVLSAVQEALRRSQDVMADEAKKITGGLKIPGLM